MDRRLACPARQAIEWFTGLPAGFDSASYGATRRANGIRRGLYRLFGLVEFAWSAIVQHFVIMTDHIEPLEFIGSKRSRGSPPQPLRCTHGLFFCGRPSPRRVDGNGTPRLVRGSFLRRAMTRTFRGALGRAAMDVGATCRAIQEALFEVAMKGQDA